MTDSPAIETNFTLQRTAEDQNSTGGEWRDAKDNVLACTLERGAKMPEHPRIPAGRYRLRLKDEGSKFDARYAQRFPRWFTSMVEVCDVPGRTEILVHTANRYTDLLGCVGIGAKEPGIEKTEGGYEIPPGTSMEALSTLYPILYRAIAAGPTWLVVKDIGAA